MAEQNSSADWLPPGWTVDVRVRKNGKKDKCYTDPSNGLKFFSKPEVLRHLNKIEANRPKSKGNREGSLDLSSINSPAIAEGLKLADSTTNGRITRNRSSKLVGVLKDEKILESCTGRKGTSVSCFNQPETMDLEQKEKSDPITGVFGLAPVFRALPEKLPENGVENPGNKRMKLPHNELNNKKKPDLPRRSSKRLAGIEIGPIPELKTNNRARRVSARLLDEAEASKAGNLGDSAAPQECAEKTDTEDNADEKQGCTIVLPPGNLSIPEEHAVQGEIDNTADEEPGSPLNFSLKDMWKDPCIEFAIKTLTGAIPIEDENKADENPGSSFELPFGDSWGDPCIEFAVKTLTGAIPVVDDLDIQDYLQEQLTSSETMGDKGSNFCHSDVLLQHFDASEKPLYDQRAPNNGNGSLQNSSDAGLHPRSEERSEGHQRHTIRH